MKNETIPVGKTAEIARETRVCGTSRFSTRTAPGAGDRDFDLIMAGVLFVTVAALVLGGFTFLLLLLIIVPGGAKHEKGKL
jgi:hypothetical protein